MSARAQRRVVSPDVSFRILDATQVEASVGGKSFPLPMSLHQLLLEFAEPSDPADVYEEVETGLATAAFADVIELLMGHGVLVDEPVADAGEPDDDAFLRSIGNGVLADRDVRAAIAKGLAAGRAVTLSDALEPAFAESVYADLLSLRGWQPYEGASSAFSFHFRQHHVFDPTQYPASLRRCTELFGSAGAKRVLSELSGKDCTGAIQLGASLYLPGDFSLPHTDVSSPKSVAFVLHLTKDWDRAWGGSLFWCPSGTQVLPAFNRLTIFNVTPTISHFVAPVSAHATGRRLAVNGWWTLLEREKDAAQNDVPALPTMPDGFVGPCYGEAPRAVDKDGRVVIV